MYRFNYQDKKLKKERGDCELKLIKGYWKSKGKRPIGYEKDRTLYYKPPKGDYVASYIDNLIVRVDIDDYDHKTGELVNPINGEPRSESIIKYLNDNGYEYILIRTENGVHIIMLKPKGFEIPKNRINWYCALGINIEVHVNNVHEPIVVNGNKRKIEKGDIENAHIDELPSGLFPVQAYKQSKFNMNFDSGDRNNQISKYAFFLGHSGLSIKEIKECIFSMNKYVLEEPLEHDEIDTILRPETMDKIETEVRLKKATLPELFGEFLDSLGIKIMYNELLNIVEYENIPNTPEYEDIVDVQNVMPIRLQHDFSTFSKKQNITKSRVVDLILLEADTHSYNPVTEYLTSGEWDGEDRFKKLFNLLGVTDELERSLIRKWFYQTAAMPFNNMNKPFQAEGVLVLQGKEGIGKTRFFQQMTVNPIWFSSLDKELTTKNKDILIQMLSIWVGEIGEVDRTFKANKSDMKSFITSRDDTIRKPYRAEQVKKARTTSFCGTTNKDTFLNDDTGSRRWWIVHITKHIDLGDFVQEDNLKQFWYQCYNAFVKNNNCFRLTKGEMESLNERNQDVMEMLPAEEELRNRFNFDAPIEEWKWTTSSALKDLCEYDVANYDVRVIGKALKRISEDDPRIEFRRTKSVRQILIPPALTLDRYRNSI